MAATYTPIASITLGANASTVTFSSIPQTYTDLVLVTNAKGLGANDLDVRVNSDSGTNYSWINLSGTGSSTTSSRGTSDDKFRLDQYGYVDTTFNSANTIHFFNYANTTTYKTVLSRAINAAQGVDLVSGVWRSTSAITSISIVITTVTGSTFNLYGILGANA